MTDTTPQQSTTNTDYGDVLHSTILKIFGDELTYNELEPYTRDKDDYSHLEVKIERNNHEGFMFVNVFIDKHKIMEEKYDVKWSKDMFYYLNELELEEDDSEEEEEDDSEDDEEKMMCVVCGNEICIGWGHNPQPIKEDGVCCNRCNQMVVIPARLLEASER
jgi:hypothetical protein